MTMGFIFLGVGLAAWLLPCLIAQRLGGVGKGSPCLMVLLGTIFILLGLWKIFI